jgi:branched-chain amino acid transport system substrate-binding protein
VPIVGQTTLGSGQTKALLKKPENWEKVYPNNFRNCSYDASGKLPPRTVEFVDRLRKANIDMSDTLLWWIALGYDGPRLMADAIREAGSAPEEIVAYWNKVKAWPGIYGSHYLDA